MDPYVFAVAHQINPRDLFVGLGFFAKQSIIHFSPIPSQSRLWSCGKTHYDHLIAEGPRISKTHLSAKSEAQLKFRSLSSRTIAATRHRCNYRQKGLDAAEPAEILEIECEQVPDSMNVHR